MLVRHFQKCRAEAGRGRSVHPRVSDPMDTVPLKTITYRGGLVRFRIPADWQEEYEEAGGGTFYAPDDQSGALRLNVLTMEAPPEKVVTYPTAMEVLAKDAVKYG